MTVNKERIELWAQALDSGEHEQCVGSLRRFGFPPEGGYRTEKNCALGVGILVAMANGCELPNFTWEEASRMPIKVAMWYGLPSTDPQLGLTEEDLQFSPDDSYWNLTCKGQSTDGWRNVISINDAMRLPFKIIAELLRRTYVDAK